MEIENAVTLINRKEYHCKKCGRILFYTTSRDKHKLYIKQDDIPPLSINLDLSEQQLLIAPKQKYQTIKHGSVYLFDHVVDYRSGDDTAPNKFHIEIGCPKCGWLHSFHYERGRLSGLNPKIRTAS